MSTAISSELVRWCKGNLLCHSTLESVGNDEPGTLSGEEWRYGNPATFIVHVQHVSFPMLRKTYSNADSMHKRNSPNPERAIYQPVFLNAKEKVI
ncbi:hypothetical protein Tco_0714058 [Tanacetum coccineum]